MREKERTANRKALGVVHLGLLYVPKQILESQSYCRGDSSDSHHDVRVTSQIVPGSLFTRIVTFASSLITIRVSAIL